MLPVYIGDDVTDKDVMRFLGWLIDLERERSPGKTLLTGCGKRGELSPEVRVWRHHAD